jgi:hypothetical protein
MLVMWACLIGVVGSVTCSPASTGPADDEMYPADGACLKAARSVEQASPHVFEYVFSSPGHAVDASAVVWSGSGQEETLVSFEGDYPACFSGGARGAVLDGGIPVDAMYECTTQHCGGTCPTPCYSYHSAAGLGPDVGALQVIEDIQIRDTGDGVSLETGAARDAVVRRVYMHNIHDDAFESDFGLGGFTVEDVLVERAHTAFAMRLRGGASGDQRDRLWTIRDNLVRLYAFPNGYKQKAGHGNVFKLDESANEPRFRMTGNTIVVGPDPGSSTLFPPVSRVEECANNVYLFLGTQSGRRGQQRGASGGAQPALPGLLRRAGPAGRHERGRVPRGRRLDRRGRQLEGQPRGRLDQMTSGGDP